MAFTIDLKHTPIEIVNKIKNAVLSNDGKFNGNEDFGDIKINTPVGEVTGNYKINGSQITIDITKKPFFLNKEMIKNGLKKYL